MRLSSSGCLSVISVSNDRYDSPLEIGTVAKDIGKLFDALDGYKPTVIPRKMNCEAHWSGSSTEFCLVGSSGHIDLV